MVERTAGPLDRWPRRNAALHVSCGGAKKFETRGSGTDAGRHPSAKFFPSFGCSSLSQEKLRSGPVWRAAQMARDLSSLRLGRGGPLERVRSKRSARRFWLRPSPGAIKCAHVHTPAGERAPKHHLALCGTVSHASVSVASGAVAMCWHVYARRNGADRSASTCTHALHRHTRGPLSRSITTPSLCLPRFRWFCFVYGSPSHPCAVLAALGAASSRHPLRAMRHQVCLSQRVSAAFASDVRRAQGNEPHHGHLPSESL